MGGYRFPFKLLVTKTNVSGKTVFRPHWHEQLEILCINNGEVFVQCDQSEFYASAGDIVVFNSCQLHKGVNCSPELDYYVLVIDPGRLIKESIETYENEEITQIAENLILFSNKIEGDVVLHRVITEIFEEYIRQDKHYGIAIKANVYRVLVSLLRKYVHRIQNKTEYAKRIRALERYNGVLLYIEKHIDKELTVEHLAQMANLSRYRFIHVFKSLTGHTLSNYINELRMEKAELLLRTTALNITELSQSVGFNDSNYFCRSFKKKNGISPIQYRKRAGVEPG